MGRRLARELALKVLYRYEEGDRDCLMMMNRLLNEKNYHVEDKTFCQILVNTTVDNLDMIEVRPLGDIV